MNPTLRLMKRIRNAGFGQLLDEYNLLSAGLVTMRVSRKLYQPTVLGPTSCDPLPGHQSFYRLSHDEYDRLLLAMFGEDPGVEAVA